MQKGNQAAVENIKSLVNTNNYPPAFNSECWLEVVNNTNCYAYALNSYIPDPLPNYTNSLYYPGFIAGEKKITYFIKKTILGRVKKDLAALGFFMLESSLEDFVEEGEHKIFISLKYDFSDYHFMRQDKSSFWSHKMGWNNKPTNRYSNGEKITDPEVAMSYAYHTVGYYKIIKKT